MLPTVPDFIFVDVKMPIMNGHEIVSELKKADAFSSVPIIMYSAQANPEDELKAKQAGTNGFYTKPSNAEKINALIEEVLNTRKN